MTIEVEHSAPVMRQHQKHVQYQKADRGHGKEVHGYQILDVIVQECAPALRRRLAISHHVLGHAGLTDLDAQFEQFPMDMGCTPQRVFAAHFADQIADFAGHRGPTHSSMPNFPGPKEAKSLAMPSNHSGGLDDV